MKRPIGLLDSGFGGLTVVKEAFKQLPNESFIYIGDNARCPYGPRSRSEILHYTEQLVDFLVKKQVKMIVIACNTATAVALDCIRRRVDIPVIGVIQPGVRAAQRVTRNERIGILGTQMTIKSGLYQKLLRENAPSLTLYPLECSKFVPLVESGEYDSPIAKKIVAETLLPLKGTQIDTLILGCTHYPLLAPIIGRFMGESVELVNSGRESIHDVSVALELFQLAETIHSPEPSISEFYTTGSTQIFKKIAEDWLQRSIDVKAVSLDMLERG